MSNRESSRKVMSPPASLSSAQRRSLCAVIDGFLPPLSVSSTATVTATATTKATAAATSLDENLYWKYRLSLDPVYLSALEESLSSLFSKSDQVLLRSFLSLVSTRLGTALLFGRLNPRSFVTSSVPQQSKYLQSLQHSSTKGPLFQLLQKWICHTAYSYTTSVGKNPHWPAMKLKHGAAAIAALVEEANVLKTMHVHEPIQQALVTVKQHYHATMNTTITEPLCLECDILIVGSGAGGCMAASVLSKAGFKVLVVEQGGYQSASSSTHGNSYLRTGNLCLATGACLGGSSQTSAANTCQPLPETVLQEWKDLLQLDPLVIAEYKTALDICMKKMQPDSNRLVPTVPNALLQRGCEIMGYSFLTLSPSLHDPSLGENAPGNKKTAMTVYLKEAATFGARILDHCRVVKLTTNTTESSRPHATGADCVMEGGATPLRIVAKKGVIVAAGALQTPCLLQASGLRNKHIGRHLKLHPTVTIAGFLREPVDTTVGASTTNICTEFEGSTIACAGLDPGQLASLLVWTTPFEYKERLRKYRHCLPLTIQQRDVGEGSVGLGLDGVTPVVKYSLSSTDKKRMVAAMKGGLQVLITAGAKEVVSGNIRDHGLALETAEEYGMLRMASDNRIQKYLSTVSRQGIKSHQVALFSPYQMGSCRMGISPFQGAVDLNGETWECDNLFVMDSSIFPSAAGVNPIITVLAIAKMLSTRLAVSLRHKDQKATGVAEATKAEELALKRRTMRDFHQSAGKRLLLQDVLPHLFLWVTVVLFFLPIIFGGIMRQPSPIAIDETMDMIELLKATTYKLSDFISGSTEALMHDPSLRTQSALWTAIFLPFLVVASRS
jgi:long-chain-alcohol oxidase